ncbi:MAG: hypothetical protein OEQ47_05115 [Acidimicrobiia bacterium]|nr:hypothetical protein [Acidimicrobiia bacterium]
MKALCVAAVLVAVVIIFRPDSPHVAPIVAGVELETPLQITAGDPLEVVVTAEFADGAPVVGVFRSAYRTAVVETVVSGARATLAAPPDVTTGSGRLEVIVRVGQTWVTAGVEVVAGKVAEPPMPLVGSRSIVAGYLDRSLVVVIPADMHGNPVPDVDTTVRARWPDGANAVIPIRRSSTLLWGWVPAGTVAGRTLVTASSGAINGMERAVRVVPSAVEQISFEIAGDVGRADGVSLFTVTTGPLTDSFGNVVLDGTAVVIETVSAAGRRSIQTVATVNGVASALVEPPAEPGPLDVIVSLGGASAQRRIDLSPAIALVAPKVSIEIRPGSDLVTVGPVLGDLGQLVPDGTTVRVTTEPGGSVVLGQTRSGYAALSVEMLDAESIVVEMGGSAVRLGVGGSP